MPLLKQISLLTAQIDLMDKQIDKLGKKYPEISILAYARGGTTVSRLLCTDAG